MPQDKPLKPRRPLDSLNRFVETVAELESAEAGGKNRGLDILIEALAEGEMLQALRPPEPYVMYSRETFQETNVVFGVVTQSVTTCFSH